MTVSSSEDQEFYHAPELRSILITAKRIRREATRLGRHLPDDTSYNRLLKNIDDLEESLNLHFMELSGFGREMAAVAAARLSKKRLMMLRWIAENRREDDVYTTLIERISTALDMPSSTVRWNLRGLRDAGLIMAGDKDNKGVPVRITERGAIMAEFMDGAVI